MATHCGVSIRRQIVLASLFAVLSPAMAQVEQGGIDLPMPPPRKVPTPEEFSTSQLAAMDVNRDGKITWEEFSARHRQAFLDMDTKKKGFLTKSDIDAAFRKAIASMPKAQ